jgi:hypothetical protein
MRTLALATTLMQGRIFHKDVDKIILTNANNDDRTVNHEAKASERMQSDASAAGLFVNLAL